MLPGEWLQTRETELRFAFEFDPESAFGSQDIWNERGQSCRKLFSLTGMLLDSHMSDWAFVQMLAAHHEHRDIESFVAVFSQAVRRGEQLSAPFTRIHPHQDSLLSWCADLELKEEFCHIAEAALYYRGNSQRLRNNIQQLQQRLALSVLKSSD